MKINPRTGEEYTEEDLEIDSARRAYRKAVDDELPDTEIERLMEIHTKLIEAYRAKRRSK